MLKDTEMSLTQCLLLIPFMFAPLAAAADSDGHYCTGDGVLAFETRVFEGETVRHLLHLVRFDSKSGIRQLAPIEIPEFQVHAIRIEGRRIVMEGSQRKRIIVDWADEERPVVIEETRTDNRNSDNQLPNLGIQAEPGVIPLKSGEGPDRFQLVIARAVQRSESESEPAIETHILTDLVRQNQQDTIIERVRLYSGHTVEYFD